MPIPPDVDRNSQSSVEQLSPTVHSDLRAIARRLLDARRASTLQPTALVHEAFLRLRGSGGEQALPVGELRPLFAIVMRRALVDHARRSRARQSAMQNVSGRRSERSGYVLALNDALTRLAATRPRLARLVELRFFGSFSVDAAAAELGVSVRTAVRDWQLAKAWLQREIEDADALA